MNIQDYAKIIKESPIPSCCVNLYMKNNNIIDIIVYEVNNEMEKMLDNFYENIIGNSLGNIINVNLDKFDLDSIVNQCMLNNGYTTEGYIYRFNDYYRLDIKNIDNERFIIWFTKVDKINDSIKKLILNSDEMIWIRNKNGRYMYVSKEYKRVMRIEKPEGKYLHEVLSKEATVQSTFMDRKIIDEKKDCVIKYTVENGIWYRSKIRALKDSTGNIIGTIGVAKDITNYKNKEYEKDFKIRILENLIDNISDTFFYKDLSGEYKIWNKQFEYYNNKESFEIENHTIGDLSSDLDFINKIKLSDELVVKTRSRHKVETVISVDGAEKKFFELVKSPVFDEDNKIVGIVGVGRDISDRKINEEKKKLDRIRLEEITENVQDVLLICEGKKVKYISSYCEKLLGVTDKDIYDNAENIWKYIHFEDLESHINLESIKNIDKIIRADIDSKTKWLWIRSKNDILKKDDLNTVIISDITAQKKSEIEIEKMRMEFFANLSHEFRTPLNLILGAIQLLKSRSEFEEHNRERYLDVIKQNSYRLLKLVDNLIDTTKIGAGCFKYNPQNYNIVSYIENICQSVVDFAAQNNIEVIFDTNKEEHIIGFDVYQMERIILNLLSNAIKFNDKEKGKIEVNMEIIPDYVIIKIKDNGIGISKENLNDIFEMFKQINNRFTKISEGSGIGLSLSKALIDMHGGNIFVDSEVGKGTEFTIKLKNELSKNLEHEYEETLDMKALLGEVERMQVEFSDIYI